MPRSGAHRGPGVGTVDGSPLRETPASSNVAISRGRRQASRIRWRAMAALAPRRAAARGPSAAPAPAAPGRSGVPARPSGVRRSGTVGRPGRARQPAGRRPDDQAVEDDRDAAAPPIAAPASAPISKPPTSVSTPSGSSLVGSARASARSTTATLCSQRATSMPVPRPVTSRGGRRQHGDHGGRRGRVADPHLAEGDQVGALGDEACGEVEAGREARRAPGRGTWRGARRGSRCRPRRAAGRSPAAACGPASRCRRRPPAAGHRRRGPGR